ncbi:MAG: hypothetical protein QXS10_03610 [Candidatus Bathyarchaeia archaeon]
MCRAPELGVLEPRAGLLHHGYKSLLIPSIFKSSCIEFEGCRRILALDARVSKHII